jgi:hypothetical protein
LNPSVKNSGESEKVWHKPGSYSFSRIRHLSGSDWRKRADLFPSVSLNVFADFLKDFVGQGENQRQSFGQNRFNRQAGETAALAEG